MAAIAASLPGLRVITPFMGANDSRQYAALIGYDTVVSPNPERIKVEVALLSSHRFGCDASRVEKPTRVLDGDVHAGEAQLDRLRPGEERFVRYATDLASLVETRTEEGRRLGEELGHENGHARHGRREQLLAGRSLEARGGNARTGVRISRDLDAALLEIDDPVLSDAGASVDA